MDRTKQVSLEELEQLANSDFCMMQFADRLEADGLLTAPKHMQDNILARSRQLDVQIVAKTNEASKNLQLFYYSLKVGFATVFALSFLLAIPQIPMVSPSRVNVFYEKAQEINDQLQEFSNQLFQMEVTFYDKQKK
ncbi:MAG: hypothetical protein RSB57_04205 [Hungatella sp.]